MKSVMWKIPSALLVASLLALLLVACENSSEPTPVPEVETLVGFPNSVGNRWVYSVYDSVRKIETTLTVDILDKVFIPGEDVPGTIWQSYYDYGRYDTSYVEISADTALIYEKCSCTDLPELFQTYRMPLTVGETRQGPIEPRDTTQILGMEEVTLPDGSTAQAYHMHRKYTGYDKRGTVEFWFVPDVGLVRAYRNEYKGGPFRVESLELKEFTRAEE